MAQEKLSILEEADKIINGAREADYGAPDKNWTDIAMFWSLYLHRKYGLDIHLTAQDGCEMMNLLKMCRRFATPGHRDSLVDGAGYLGLIERIQSAINGVAIPTERTSNDKPSITSKHQFHCTDCGTVGCSGCTQ